MNYGRGMKRDAFIKVRVTAEEKKAFQEVATTRNVDLSEIIRAHLDRLVRRLRRKDDAS